MSNTALAGQRPNIGPGYDLKLRPPEHKGLRVKTKKLPAQLEPTTPRFFSSRGEKEEDEGSDLRKGCVDTKAPRAEVARRKSGFGCLCESSRKPSPLAGLAYCLNENQTVPTSLPVKRHSVGQQSWVETFRHKRPTRWQGPKG